MWRVLILAWAVPLVWLPHLGGMWDTYWVPRNTLLVWGSLVLPWWRGSWTRLEWGLLAVSLLGAMRQWHHWGVGHALVWAAGLLVVRAVRGLPEASRARVSRTWWAGMVPMIGYGWLQVAVPSWDPWPATMIISTAGGPHFLAEALLPAVLAAPWWLAGPALGLMAWTGQRGPLVALLIASVAYRRWVLAGVLVLAGLPVLWTRPGLESLAVRWEVWGRTASVIAANPWAGVGTGGYPWTTVNERPLVLAPREAVVMAHNEYLERAAEWGIPGGLLFLAWVIVQARGSAALAAMALAAVTGFTFMSPFTWAIWCILAGAKGEKKWRTYRGPSARIVKGTA